MSPLVHHFAVHRSPSVQRDIRIFVDIVQSRAHTHYMRRHRHRRTSPEDPVNTRFFIIVVSALTDALHALAVPHAADDPVALAAELVAVAVAVAVVVVLELSPMLFAMLFHSLSG